MDILYHTDCLIPELQFIEVRKHKINRSKTLTLSMMRLEYHLN